ncbi:CAP domain-containing protein [Salimicrobium halophilum]|uniref:Cysteine-rich secretory protein family protein n=1 Tax=Salimicrobium halophilum TaxID=86666 RepID=A0A1G8S6R6_9BACI|nr:CAP domain-containing protein [Salimicrobium halophilum]SDJ24887.1 Cysteine-rich secretory protein family protein [Salimicrobium halophilum]
MMRRGIAFLFLIVLFTWTIVTVSGEWETIRKEIDTFIETVDQWERGEGLEGATTSPDQEQSSKEPTEALPDEKLQGESVRTIYGTSWVLSEIGNGNVVFGDEEGTGKYIWKPEEGFGEVNVGASASSVAEAWGEPEESVRRGMTNVSFPADHYDIYVRDDKEITVFYDRHEGNIVKSIYVVSQGQATGMNRYYAQAENWVDEDQAQIMFGLINKDRVSRGLNPLTWREELVPVAEAHSKDMNRRDYFSHTNPDGEGPADRAKEAGISFRMIGENLAYGQSNAVYAHEGLMDSKGHRENILNPHYEEVAIGIDVNDEGAPYFTVLFYTGR